MTRAAPASRTNGDRVEPESYFRREADGRYHPTAHTEGPWDPRLQHGGPPLALAVHAMLRAHPSDLAVASVALDFLGPVPLAPIAITTAVRRPGARVELLEAELAVNGRAAAEVRMWRSRRDTALDVPGVVDHRASSPDDFVDAPMFAEMPPWGYGESITWRVERGSPERLGPATVWGRCRVDLLPDEPIDPLARALVIADSANGISAALPLAGWLFVPTGIVVTLRRDPVGEWVRLDAETTLGPDGRALCRATLGDRDGLVGVVEQSLFVSRR